MSTALNTSKATPHLKCDRFVLFNVMQRSEFDEKAPTLSVDVKEFLVWVRIYCNVHCLELVSMELKRAAGGNSG